MATEKIYLGPDFSEPPKQKPPVDGSIRNQLRAFGIPEDQLKPEAELAPAAGLPKEVWRELGLGQS